MSKYIDGFVLKIPNDKKDEYIKMAQEGKESWMRHGALQYFECRGDDMKIQEIGDEKTRSFTEMVGTGENETVWFSFIVFKSKEHRDEVNAKVYQEMGEKMKDLTDIQMPFKMEDMAYGGFLAEVEG